MAHPSSPNPTVKQLYVRTAVNKRRLKLAIEAGAPAVKIARLQALYERNRALWVEAKMQSFKL